MTKSLLVNPDVVRAAGVVKTPDIPVNAYQLDFAAESARYGAEGLTNMLHDMIVIRAFEGRMDLLVTHPVFGYRCSWRSIVRMQVRLFGRWLRGDVPTYIGMVTR